MSSPQSKRVDDRHPATSSGPGSTQRDNAGDYYTKLSVLYSLKRASPKQWPIPTNCSLIQTWPHDFQDAELDGLLGRVSRAYCLVCAYHHQCPRGQRWRAVDIEAIRKRGETLCIDLRILGSMIDQILESSEDLDTTRSENWQKSQRAVEFANCLKRDCRDVERLINETENIPEEPWTSQDEKKKKKRKRKMLFSS
jgi:hypothetical protein